MRIRYAIAGIALILAAWVIPVAFRHALDATPEVLLGEPAPPFQAVTLDGRDSLSLDDYRGRVVLLNLWATWCAPCREEMPAMQRLRMMIPDSAFAVVAVNVDSRETPRQIRAFADELDLTFDILHDESDFTATQYQVYGLPQSYLIDATGLLRVREFGAVHWDDSTHVGQVRELLAAAGSS